VVESSALLKRRSPKGYRGFESLPHRADVDFRGATRCMTRDRKCEASITATTQIVTRSHPATASFFAQITEGSNPRFTDSVR
jgi:hypothetical protein